MDIDMPTTWILRCPIINNSKFFSSFKAISKIYSFSFNQCTVATALLDLKAMHAPCIATKKDNLFVTTFNKGFNIFCITIDNEL